MVFLIKRTSIPKSISRIRSVSQFWRWNKSFNDSLNRCSKNMLTIVHSFHSKCFPSDSLVVSLRFSLCRSKSLLASVDPRASSTFGYIYNQFYYNQNCNGTIFGALGASTEACLPFKNNSFSFSFSNCKCPYLLLQYDLI